MTINFLGTRRAAWRVAAILHLASAACGGETSASEHARPPETAAETRELASNMASAIDPAADPCQDFYRYACGGWLDSAKLGDDETYRFFQAAQASIATDQHLDALMQNALDNPGGDGAAQRIRAFFGSCIDESSIDAAGTTPLAPYLDAIEQVVDGEGLLRELGALHGEGITPLFAPATAVLPDGNNAFMLGQIAFPLGDKDAYLRDDAASAAIRGEYITHIARMLELSGDASELSVQHAKSVLAIETALASASLTPAQQTNRVGQYHPTTLEKLKQTYPSIPWDVYLERLGLAGLSTTINVLSPDYFAALEHLLSVTELADLRMYMRWCVLHSTVQDLTAAFRDADFDFFQRTLAGAIEAKPRRKLCTEQTRAAIPDSVSAGYVAQYFPEASRAAATTLLDGIALAFRDELQQLAWLDDATRQWSLDKSRAMTAQIGYPDHWDDYAGLELSVGDHFGNARRVARFVEQRTLSKVGKPPDRDAWPWDAATNNAAYQPETNTMNFPAGILQAPYFSAAFPSEANYGNIGCTMGHELTHGFDGIGRIYDGHGVPGAYWSSDATAAFDRQTACLVDQFNGYEALPGLNVNGMQTLGENIADLGGLKLAFAAFQHQPAHQAAHPPLVDGLSDEQAFFVAYAQSWCVLVVDAAERQFVLSDVHAPSRFRVNGPLSNSTQFAEAFACHAGDPMVRADRCEVW